MLAVLAAPLLILPGKKLDPVAVGRFLLRRLSEAKGKGADVIATRDWLLKEAKR